MGRNCPGGGGRRVQQNPIEGGDGGHRHERRTPSHAGARRALDRAQVLFGAPRMLESFAGNYKKYPFYTRDRILPVLSELQETSREETVCAGILFSGDTGFYSGCRNLVPALKKLDGAEVQVLPGISSVSAWRRRWESAGRMERFSAPTEFRKKTGYRNSWMRQHTERKPS